MPLLDELGLTPRVQPVRSVRQEQNAALKDLLNPLTGKLDGGIGQQGQAGDGSTRPDATMNRLLDAVRALQVVQGAPSPGASVTIGLNATGSGSAAPTTSAPTGATPASLAGIIGKRNYKTGRGDPSIRAMAQQVANSMGWGGDQFAALDALINAESGWNPNAQNPTSTAYGLGQFLNSTWKGYGPKTSDPAIQLQYMAKYIKGRYGDPIHALIEHNRKNWY